MIGKERIISRLRITGRVWLRHFVASPKFLDSLGTSDTLSPLSKLANERGYHR